MYYSVGYKEDQNKLDVQLALLVHAYWRSGRDVNFSFTSGVAVNVKSQRPNYLLGASLLLGRKQRIAISGGVNFGITKRLSNSYQLGNLLSLDTEEVPMAEKMDAGGWFGVSYNFGHLN